MDYSGIWIPFITPFKDGQVDYASLQKIIRHYTAQGATGLVPMGTTGESPTISAAEYERVLAATLEYNEAGLPVVVGLGSSDTADLLKRVKMVEKYPVQGILSVCPYYNRPGQEGIYEHFTRLAETTYLDIIIYNIPYRTGREIANDTLRRLAEQRNIVALKDASGDFNQSLDLLLDRPDNFQILCGEDLMFYSCALLGADGGILASAHIHLAQFIEMLRLIRANDHQAALEVWQRLAAFIPLIFAEPSPGPLKYLLQREGLIASDEIRLPMTNISPELAQKLDAAIKTI